MSLHPVYCLCPQCLDKTAPNYIKDEEETPMHTLPIAEKIHEADTPNNTPLMKVLPYVWKELLQDEVDSNEIIVAWNQKALWVETEDTKMVAGFITYELQEWRRACWIHLSFTVPIFRRQGIYRTLFKRLTEICREKKLYCIDGGIAIKNTSMRAAAAALGRQEVFVTSRFVL